MIKEKDEKREKETGELGGKLDFGVRGSHGLTIALVR